MAAGGDLDFIVVGAGSAGGALASRLSEDPGSHVLLIEAGPDTPPDNVPALIRDIGSRSSAEPGYLWPGLLAETIERPGSNAPGPLQRFEQARVMGGGSSLMGMFAFRGLPADYDEWEAQGAVGWGWQGVLPYFKRLERDLDRDGALHGKDGPVAIRHLKPERWPPFCQAVGAALRTRGYRYVSDLTGDFGDGHGPAPMSNVQEHRVSSASAYLGTTVRARPTLRIVTDRMVERLIIDGHRIAGVEIVAHGERNVWRARDDPVGRRHPLPTTAAARRATC